jgi:hypothetical protein
VLDKRRARKEATDEGAGGAGGSSAETGKKAEDKAERRPSSYKQRQAVDKVAMKEKGMEGVLGSVFG